MPGVPECLRRRYRALDELIGELSALPGQRSHDECFGDTRSQEPGIKLMCDFWNILKEDPDCDLSHAVKKRMGLDTHESGSMFPRQKVTCYMAGRCRGSDNKDYCEKKDPLKKIKDICCDSHTSNRSADGCPTSCSRDKRTPEIPLTKALCNLKEAASFDKKCNIRVMELVETQKELKAQIQTLEMREKEGVTLLKEADCMWSCMEEEYKKKIAESLDRHKDLMRELKEVEKSNAKWRKNKKELEDQLKHVCKCRQEMHEKSVRKKNDLKVIELEKTDLIKRVAANKRVSDGGKQNLTNKRTSSDKRIAKIATDVTKLKSQLSEAQKHKTSKEQEGLKFVREARDDLQKISKVLLQKKIENEDLSAEKDAILQEIELLKQTCDQCKDKCQIKRDAIKEEIAKVENDISDYKYQCMRCHECTDTVDVRTLCSDCPICKEKRECITAGDYCERDLKYDCVCIGVKGKFLNNVFENMYTILERQSTTKPGKALADSIVRCLRNSRNGKLTAEAKMQVQAFVLNTVKKNLNLTIVGGAVKTRCEMDPDTYNQLMICMKKIKEEKAPKEDKGTAAKKEPCFRWGGPTECYCPGGPKFCACTRRAPPPPELPKPCPPVLEKEPDPTEGTVVLCPHKEAVGCGPECAMRGVVPRSDDAAAEKTNSCETDCPFKKDMRAAQCVLGPESLNSLPRTYMSSTPYVPDDTGYYTVSCKCGGYDAKRCVCGQGAKQLKAGHCNMSTCTACDEYEYSINDIYNGYPFKQGNYKNMLDEHLVKHEHYKKRMTTSISSQATALAESVCNIDCLLKQNIPETNEMQSDVNASDFHNETIQLDSPVTTVCSSSENFSIEVKEKFTDLLDTCDEDPKIFKNFINITSSNHSVHPHSKNIRDRLLEVNCNSEPKTPNKLRIQDNSQASITSNIQRLFDKPYISMKKENKLQLRKSLEVLKSDLQQKYQENKTTAIKLKTETGLCKVVLAPVTKTLSGNIAVDLNKLDNALKIKNKESYVTITRSESGAIILEEEDVFANSVIRKTASGSFLLVMVDPVFRSREPVKRISPSVGKYYKVKIESNEYHTAEPPAVLKATPSHNYLVVPDKEYEVQYREMIKNILEDSIEYYVNLTKIDSLNCVIQIDDSWVENEPNALVVRTDSGNVKIITRRNDMVDTGKERSLITSSSKVLGEVINKLPRSITTKKASISSAWSMIAKKSSSDSNIYEKVKLFYSEHKDLLVEPSAILRLTKSGQYAVVLGKESKVTFIKNLNSYLKNNFKGLVPLKKTESGDITIALNGEHTDSNNYGSLKITPSGNLYVIVDNELVKQAPEEQSLHTNSSISGAPSIPDVTSKHWIGKLRYPVNKAVTTTCNAMPEKDCDKSKCDCENIEFKKIDWILNRHQTDKTINFFESQVSGMNWRKVTNNFNASYTICDDKRAYNSDEGFGDTSGTKALPHIIIKPCNDKRLLNNPKANQQQCFYVIEAVCPFNENMSNWSDIRVSDNGQGSANWDSLSFLPPQLPDFLKSVKYK